VTKSRNLIAKRRVWTDDEIAYLRREYPNVKASAIAAHLGINLVLVYRKASLLGLAKSDEFKTSEASGRLSRDNNAAGAVTRFKPGQTSWNKGNKGYDAGGRSHETRFKRGAPPHNKLPIGSYRINSEGYLDKKIGENGSKGRDWIAVHRLVWVLENGEIPDGHMVVFKKGQHTTELDKITIDALELVTREEHMRRHSYHNNYPKEIAQLIQLRGAVVRQINKRKRQHEKQD
jgi:hypothetical protein